MDSAYNSAPTKQALCLVLLDPQLSSRGKCPFGGWLLVILQVAILQRLDKILKATCSGLGAHDHFMPLVNCLPWRRRPVSEEMFSRYPEANEISIYPHITSYSSVALLRRSVFVWVFLVGLPRFDAISGLPELRTRVDRVLQKHLHHCRATTTCGPIDHNA